MSKDIVDKYYAICEMVGDDVNKAAFLIKVAGAHQRPSFICKDLSFLWILKYSEQIEIIYSAIQNKESCGLLVELSRFAIAIGRKYHFDPMVEVKHKAEIKKEKVVIVNKTDCFDFWED